LLKRLGPGLITGASDDDPSGIGTYSQAGSAAGIQYLLLSGGKDITNVLVANLDNKITAQAYLYDLLITDRNIIVYRPEFPTGSASDLKVRLYIPDDDNFKHLTNRLLSHDSMECVVASFHDLDGWFDSVENDGDLNDYTIEHLSSLSTYTAQLMEPERLHGFCFVRKRWKEISSHYGNSLILCAVNPSLSRFFNTSGHRMACYQGAMCTFRGPSSQACN
jgi:hypothetical protein